MNESEIRKVVFDTMETYLELQLQALRQMSTEAPLAPSQRTRGKRKRMSMVDQTVEILTGIEGAMHVDELVVELLRQYGRVTDRDSLASALGKKTKQNGLLEKTAPATFAVAAGESQ
jgi:hypothetical protein